MKLIMSVMLLTMMVSVSALYGGETIIVDLPNTETVEYNITGNSSNLDGLTLYQNGSKFFIETVDNMYPDNFTIIIFKEDFREEVSIDSGSSSRSGISVPGWSAKCGYNKECLYGKTNETNVTNVQEVVDTIPTPIEDPIEPEPKTSKWIIPLTILGFIIGIGIIIYLLYLIFRNKDKVDYEN